MTENLSSWFEKGRPALFGALENVCRQIDTDIRAGEFNDNRQDITRLTGSELEPKATTTGEFPAGWKDGHEGVDWDWQHCTALEKGAERYDPDGTSSNEASLWRRKVPLFDWKLKYGTLQQKYIALNGSFKKARERFYKLREERDKSREETKLLHALIEAAEQKHGVQILGASSRGTEISRGLRRELDSPHATREGSFTSVGIPENALGALSTEASHEPMVTRGEDKTDTSEHEQLGSTQGESEGRADKDLPPLPVNDEQGVVVKEEPSSDGPVFVSKRCTNKRKRDERDAATPVARIKTESGRSSPEMSLHRCDFDPHESIDLGEAPSAIWTPRKQRQMEFEASQRRMHSVEAAEQGPALEASGYARVGPPPLLSFGSALTPVNINRRLPQPPATAPSGDKPLRRGLTHGIQDLAEDGGVYKKGEHQAQRASSATKGRLDSLLNSPLVADDSTPIHRSIRRQLDYPTTPQVELGVPRPRALPFEGNARTTDKPTGFQTPQSRPPLADTTNTFPKAKAIANKNKRASPKKAPGLLLRNKPVAQLRAEDFKINPKANKGHDYAFSEVVRDKDERAQLPGCVDEHCCGPTFRALAESEYPDDPSVGQWRQNEQKLLEEYLGDYAFQLTGMSREQRKKLWIEARMQTIANKHGKHKHHTSRMRSPPGFWQFDFPNTQEIEAERAEAARREKQKVQERHREAMRPGGRWLFRDE